MKALPQRASGLWMGLLLLVTVWSAGCHGQDSLPEKAEKGGRDIIANNAFFYYADLEGAWRFYRDVLGLETVADYGFAKIMRIAGTSYLTLVDAASGMHTADEPKTVAIALITDELDDWYRYLRSVKVPMKFDYDRKEGRPHDGFVIEDPEGYYLELERFNPHPENERLMPLLARMETVYTGSGGSGTKPEHLGFKATILPEGYYHEFDTFLPTEGNQKLLELLQPRR